MIQQHPPPKPLLQHPIIEYLPIENLKSVELTSIHTMRGGGIGAGGHSSAEFSSFSSDSSSGASGAGGRSIIVPTQRLMGVPILWNFSS